MKRIKLTQGKYALVNDEDFGALNQWKWCAKVGSWGTYAVRRPWDKVLKSYSWVYMHREVNRTPKGMFTDHKNGNGLDNRRKNLRTVTIQKNAFNTRVYSTSKTGYKGVQWDRVNKKWVSRIMVYYKNINLGRFSKMKDAIRARRVAEKIYHAV